MTSPLVSLRDVDEAEVWKQDRRAGHLRRRGSTVTFTYDTGYLADPAAPEVASSLPKGLGPWRHDDGSVPPFFAGLLPEGVRLTAVAAGTKTSTDDHLTLLLAIGGDPIGDVRVLPVGQPPGTSSPFADPADPAFDLSDIFRAATDPTGGSIDPIALPGVQPKVSASIMSTPVTSREGPAILKLSAPTSPRLVENEDFFLRMAADCGLLVNRHRLITDRGGRTGLLVTRFDRIPRPDGSCARLAQEDGCQALGVFPSRKYQEKTETVATRLADLVDRGGGSRLLALRRIFEIVAFSYLIGNGDLHAKNLSVHDSGDGSWAVTPAYDLLCTQPYARWNDPMALNLYGRANRLGRSHLLFAADRLGLPQGAAVRALDGIVERAEPWVARVSDIGFDDRPTELLAELLAARRTELLEA